MLRVFPEGVALKPELRMRGNREKGTWGKGRKACMAGRAGPANPVQEGTTQQESTERAWVVMVRVSERLDAYV
jgi:hypothetical protein